ncbi:MAG TPA: PorV/PorQ family protein [Ignavibacteria bacterium]
MKNRYIFLLLIISLNLYSQTSSGLKFLLTFDSKTSSLGESSIMNTVGSSATLANPSNLNLNKGVEFQIGITKLFTDVNTQNLLFKTDFSNKVSFGFHILNYRISDLEIRDIPGEPIGTFNVQYLSTGVSSSYLVNENLSIGMSLKMLYEKIFIEEASGYSFDFGIYYILNNKTRFGLTLTNLGNMNELKYDKTALPTTFGIGCQYNYNVSIFSNYFTLEYKNNFKDKTNHFSIGVETFYNDLFFTRFGYITGFESKDFTFGMGIKYWGINLNYSFIPYSFDLGDSHSISLIFSL